MKTQRPVMIVAAVSMVAALFGLYYNGASLFAAFGGHFSDLVAQQKLTGFYAAFYTMSGICVACYLLLLACGVNLLRGRLRWSGLFTGVVIFEVVYFFAVGALWLWPSGMSIAAATGVANGGLMIQFIILFPLWAPLLLWRARKPARNAHLES